VKENAAEALKEKKLRVVKEAEVEIKEVGVVKKRKGEATVLVHVVVRIAERTNEIRRRNVRKKRMKKMEQLRSLLIRVILCSIWTK